MTKYLDVFFEEELHFFEESQDRETEDVLSVPFDDGTTEYAGEGNATASDGIFSTEENVTTETHEESKSDSGISLRDVGIGMLLGAGLVLVVVAIVAYLRSCKKESAQAVKDYTDNTPNIEKMTTNPVERKFVDISFRPGMGKCEIGTLHNIGKRGVQQDCLGTTETKGGTFAIVADGMGGLADGDKVSQKIVFSMLKDASALPVGGNERCLYEMVARANREVNKMLGPSGLYKSGSTLISVLVEEGVFHWVSVGDSRIYMYRAGQLIQINPEHTFEGELLQQAVNGEISFAEAKKHPKRKGLTSFIGMGELKYVDGSKRGIPTESGDSLLLMSDGVFNTLKESEICDIIRENEDVKQAALILEQEVLNKANPKQDNFTAVILKL